MEVKKRWQRKQRPDVLYPASRPGIEAFRPHEALRILSSACQWPLLYRYMYSTVQLWVWILIRLKVLSFGLKHSVYFHLSIVRPYQPARVQPSICPLIGIDFPSSSMCSSTKRHIHIHPSAHLFPLMSGLILILVLLLRRIPLRNHIIYILPKHLLLAALLKEDPILDRKQFFFMLICCRWYSLAGLRHAIHDVPQWLSLAILVS